MSYSFGHTKQKFIFLLGITAIYAALLAWLNFLQGPFWADESAFWSTSLTFSDRLIPTIESLRDYNELNTPLPFIIFGILEYLFGQGIWVGRLFNLILSIGIVFIIGWPGRRGYKCRMLCAVGLLLCPYYLLLSGRLYTEMIACTFGILGFASYVRNRHLLSSVAFILAIASRQYMLAFPVAIAAYEIVASFTAALYPKQCDPPQTLTAQRDAQQKVQRKFRWRFQWRLMAPALAALSILGWFLLFNGLAPQTAIAIRNTPAVQKTIWAVEPGVAVNFLAIIGAYIVIPEFFLFQPLMKLKSIKLNWRRIALTALGCFLLFLIFPPVPSVLGPLSKLSSILPTAGLKIGMLYVLALLTCIRFYKPNLMTFIIFFNSLMMIKAFPWDKYVLSVAVIFWYLKSIDFEEKYLSLFGTRKSA